MNLFKILLFCIAVISFSDCRNDKGVVSKNGACFSGIIEKSVTDQEGVVYYNTLEKKYAVIAPIPGTYDSQDVGFVCEISDTLKKDGLPVRFTGNYYPYLEGHAPQIGGQTYYFLDLTAFEIVVR